MYIPNLVNVMYIRKKNTLSLAHLLIHIYHALMWKKSRCAHLLAPKMLGSKNVMYINNNVNAMYTKNTLPSSPILK